MTIVPATLLLAKLHQAAKPGTCAAGNRHCVVWGFPHTVPTLAPNHLQWGGTQFGRYEDKLNARNSFDGSVNPIYDWERLQYPVTVEGQGSMYGPHWAWNESQIGQLYCNRHSILYEPLGIYNNITDQNDLDGRKGKYAWFADDGTVNTLDRQRLWQSNVMDCSDWYHASYDDYITFP